MEVNTDPKARSNLKLVGPNAGWRFRKAREEERARLAKETENLPKPPQKTDEDPATTS